MYFDQHVTYETINTHWFLDNYTQINGTKNHV